MKLACTTLGEGPDLLLIHGWGMNLAVWQPLVSELEGDFRITLVDLPGHGESPWNETMQTLDDWTQMVLETAPKQAIWAGWSLGGLLMQRARMLAPERLCATLGIATTPCFIRHDDWPHGIAPEILPAFARELESDNRRTLRRFLALQVQGAEDARATLLMLRKEFDARPEPRPEALRVGLRLLMETDLRDLAEDSAPPARWLLGERDTLVPMAAGKSLSGQVQVIPGAAHAPFLSHAGICAAVLRELKSHV
ncbi:pimeloyl-ACP methyl ester esterase BioH [Thiolapillus sp.]